MNENRKTFIYLAVAAVALLIAWEPWRNVSPASNIPAEVGTKLFPEFKDPLAANSLEVVQFDENNATIRPFKVAQVNGLWSIPSHSNYPADAREHMAQAAVALLGVEVLGVASSNPGDQELYGVIAPDPKNLRPGMVGVGTRVTIKDGKDKVLADLIIGKDDKDRPGLRYVRRADRDQICRVNIKTDKFSTKFEDWIEKDLLKLAAFDVRKVELNDYSLEEGTTAQGGLALQLHPRAQAKLAFDADKSAWSLSELAEFDAKGQPVASQLADDEELNADKLNGLKTALDDLQIVDVERKPKGLSQDLRASDEFVKDNEARASLIQRGFYPVPMKGQIEIFSSEGEANCTTKDGVKYVLRFGQLAGGSEPKDDKEGDDKDKKAKSNPALNRYLFVMAQFDPDQIPRPQLEALPGEEKPTEQAADDKKVDGKQADESKADEKAADESKADAQKAEEAKPAEPKEQAKPAAEKPAAAKVPQKKTADNGEAETPPAETTEKPAEKPADETAEKPADESAEKQADEAKDEQKPAADKPADAKPAAAKAASPDEEKRIAVEKENSRRQSEYDDAVKKGQDKVKELNDRFADWYFIISDDVYKKIHLGRADIVKKKKADDDKESAQGVGDHKQFENGLKPE